MHQINRREYSHDILGLNTLNAAVSPRIQTNPVYHTCFWLWVYLKAVHNWACTPWSWVAIRSHSKVVNELVLRSHCVRDCYTNAKVPLWPRRRSWGANKISRQVRGKMNVRAKIQTQTKIGRAVG